MVFSQVRLCYSGSSKRYLKRNLCNKVDLLFVLMLWCYCGSLFVLLHMKYFPMLFSVLFATCYILSISVLLMYWQLTIRSKDIIRVTKEKTARVIPNAIQICTKEDKYFFTSFGTRDKTFLMLDRVWKNGASDQVYC